MRFVVAAILLLVSAPAAAQVKISGLPSAATPLAGTEIVPVVQSGITKQATVAAVGQSALPSLNVASYGAKCDGSTVDTAAFNSAIFVANSTSQNIVVPAGTCIVSTLNPITANGVQLIGQSKGSTAIASNVTSGNTVTFTGQFSGVSNIQFRPLQFKTGGFEIVVSGGYHNTFNDVFITYAYNGVQVYNTSSLFLHNIECRYLVGISCLYISGSAGAGTYGTYVQNLIADNPYTVPVYAANIKTWGNSATYAAGDIFTVGGYIWQAVTSGTSQSSGTPSPVTSSATAWVSTNVTSGSASLRMVANQNLIWLQQDSYAYSLTCITCALIDGGAAYVMQDTAATGTSYPQWGYFFDLEADHNYYENVLLQGGLGAHIINSYLGSALAGNAVTITNAYKGETDISSARIMGAYWNGVSISTGTQQKFNNNIIVNNSVASSGTYHGIVVAAGVTDFTITNNTTGFVTPFSSANQGWGILVNTGASDYYAIQGNAGHGNVSGSVADGGSGSHKSVANNF